MSVQSEIDRIKKNVDDTLKVISDTGVQVGTGSDALPAAAQSLIEKVQGAKVATGVISSISNQPIKELIGYNSFCLFTEVTAQTNIPKNSAIVSLFYTPKVKSVTKTYAFGIMGSETMYYEPGYADGITFNEKTGVITLHQNSGHFVGNYRYVAWKS